MNAMLDEWTLFWYTTAAGLVLALKVGEQPLANMKLSEDLTVAQMQGNMPFTLVTCHLHGTQLLAADLVQVPGIEEEEEPLSSKDGPDSDHAAVGIMQLGPCQAAAPHPLC